MAFCHVARAYAHAGQREKADEFFSQALKASEGMLNAEKVWKSALVIFFQAKQCRYAALIAKRLEEVENYDMELMAVAEGLVQAGAEGEAREILSAGILARPSQEPRTTAPAAWPCACPSRVGCSPPSSSVKGSYPAITTTF